MIDLHCHIIPNLDDGSNSLTQTLNMINKEINLGYKGAFATSHFIPGSLEYNIEKYKTSINELNEILNLKNIDFKIYPANEIYYTPELISLLDSGRVLTLNNSKYFLMELPMNGIILGLEEFLVNLIKLGYIPIIAHPERYCFTDSKFDFILNLKEKGVQFQVNIASILGYYGKYSKKNVIKLFKEGIVDYIGTDAHEDVKIYDKYKKAIKKIRKILSEEKLNEILYNNVNNIIEN